jgi:hypothetical protein
LDDATRRLKRPAFAPVRAAAATHKCFLVNSRCDFRIVAVHMRRRIARSSPRALGMAPGPERASDRR